MPSVDEPVVIVNPRSGGGLSERRWASVAGVITDGLGAFKTRFTECAGDGCRIAREEAALGRRLVIALGGDGTISEVTDGLVAGGSGAELGIIPRGTGGDFSRTIELPRDLGQAARRVRDARARAIDVGRVTFTSPDGTETTRHFVNVASFGFSSSVATKANASSKRFGAKAAFLAATLRTLVSYDNADVFYTVDGGAEQRGTVLLGAIGNGRFFGGGMKISPDSLLDDGLLDLVLVGDLGRMEIVSKIHRLYDGSHLSMKEVRTVRARRISIRPADPTQKIPLELDGETPGTLPATFEVLPGALRLRA